MLVNKTLLGSVLVFCAASLPVLTYAADLIVVNQTNEDSTTSVPSPLSPVKCSSGMPGGFGVTKAGTTNKIPYYLLTTACVPNLTNCTVDIFMNNSCQGASIAKVTFNVTAGGLVGQPVYADKHPRYKIDGSGYNIAISYNPAAATTK